MKKINDAARFLLDNGLLLEINRKVLHPLGLALEVEVNSKGQIGFGKLWDCREDPEGLIYDDESFNVAWEKRSKFMEEFGDAQLSRRNEKLGFIVQEMAVKLAVDVPDPPEITEETKLQLAEESKLWREEMNQKVKAVENLNEEDYRTIVK